MPDGNYRSRPTESANVSKQTAAEAPSLEVLIAGIEKELGLAPAEAHCVPSPKPSLGVTRSYLQRQYIQFLLVDTMLAVPLAGVVEIGYLPKITALPNLPSWLLGISNLRGEIISVVDLKAFFGLPSHNPKKNNHFIILHNDDMKIGIMVDRVTGIFALEDPAAAIQKSPYASGASDRWLTAFIAGVVVSGEQMLNILDVDKLLSSPHMNRFSAKQAS